eukprot:1390448-Prymnesium_polylepis.1
MRALVAEARGAAWHWLGVHVPREANVDADRLSHPVNLPAALADARRADLMAEHLVASDVDWTALRTAIGTSVA